MQFKNATANNGKRKAAQQYYNLVVELYAHGESEERVLVSYLTSSSLVIRGRSPSHYTGTAGMGHVKKDKDATALLNGCSHNPAVSSMMGLASSLKEHDLRPFVKDFGPPRSAAPISSGPLSAGAGPESPYP
ncbi:hypothetical protein HDU91_005271, partial [Kappamyces sp. JEL0680]